MSVFGLAKSQPAEPAQKGHVLVWPPEHFTVVYTLWVYIEHIRHNIEKSFLAAFFVIFFPFTCFLRIFLCLFFKYL